MAPEDRFTEADVHRYAYFVAGHPDARVGRQHLNAARAILDGLAQDGRLLPSGGEVSTQWGVRSVAFPNNRARAVNEAQARQWLGGDLSTVVGPVELIRQSVTTWPDGTKLVDSWSPVLSDNREGDSDG